MPTYDYQCNNCDYQFEAFHSMSTEPLVDCPKCCQPKLIKLIGMGATVIVRGTENPCTGRLGGQTPMEKEQPKPKDRLGEGSNKSKKPFWRDGPINKKILKNPVKYIKKGEVG